MADDLPTELVEAFKILDPAQADRLKEALAPVAGELGPRERAVLERLVKGMASGVPASDLNAFVRLLPVTVSRAIQPAIPTAKA
jgi:FixJ family two-component response regulator